jgi:hypothetical protein
MQQYKVTNVQSTREGIPPSVVSFSMFQNKVTLPYGLEVGKSTNFRKNFGGDVITSPVQSISENKTELIITTRNTIYTLTKLN